MPIGNGSALAMHRGGGGSAEHHNHQLLLERMAPRAAAVVDRGRDKDRRLTRLLVNVTVDRSLWPVHLVLGADATVADLVRAAVDAYVREGRRPPLPLQPAGAADGDAADGFELHLNKYSLESTLQLHQQQPDLCSALIAFPRSVLSSQLIDFVCALSSGLRLDEKVLDLGSRNFFLCARRPAAVA